MRQLLALLTILTLGATTAFGQGYKVVRKIKTILPEQSCYLNGGIRSNVGGKSRVFYQVDIPENAIGWVYAFTTIKNDQGDKILNLAAKATKILDPTGLTELAVETIGAPSGVATADIFVCDRENIAKFMEKVDRNGGSFKYHSEPSRQNYRQGVVPVRTPGGGTYYIGIRNPQEVDGVTVNLEVIAVVEERVPIKKTEEQEKAELYGKMGWQAYTENNYDKCNEYCKKALEFDENIVSVKFTLGLCHLVEKKSDCVDAYMDAIAASKRTNNAKGFLQKAKQNINDAIQHYRSLPNAEDISNLLSAELMRLEQ